ncbi:DUF6036 family nucleotidyltransferase [Amnibacterium flavum]|uniref:DUF6036 domain-containing protein n=1 Tax=Amnibacterium flavum TaxID=2173173 RepID=A0A2V1HNV9_9MICO|nr:DUF6036 family nucleotidyltransferase [Amnibacterium flavum]PVZ93282.1 hypothetical protein DDQ50_16415 [Amnibacterium flavum]
MALLTRDDLLEGLNELIDELAHRGVRGGIQIIGGAALALRYFDRSSTEDIDARFQITGDASAAVAAIGQRHGWGGSWLNDAGAKYIPSYGTSVDWETLLERDGLTIQVASAEALLAMKLGANRPGRDNDDIAHLMVICGINTAAEAEAHFERFYPGDALSDRAERMVERILLIGLPPLPHPPTAAS